MRSMLPRTLRADVSTRRRAAIAVLGTAALTAAAAGLALSATAAGTAPANLLANADFETGTLSGWTCAAGLGSVVTTPVHGGKYALAGAASSADTAQCSQTVAVQPNTTYTLSGWVQGSYVYLGVTGSGADTSTWASPSSFTQLATTFTTGASVTSVSVWVHGWYGQGSYFADDLALTGGSTPPPPTSSPSSSGSSSPSASPTSVPTTPTSSASTPTACADPAWVSTTAYNGSARVSYGNHEWHAKWWTQGDIPGNNSQNVWTDGGVCGPATSPPPTSSSATTPPTTPSTTPSTPPTSTSSSAPPPTGAVVNGGFEIGTLSPWTCTGTAAVVGSPVHTGAHAVKGSPSSSDDAQCSQTVTVKPNTKYTLSGWIQGNYVYLGVTGSGADTSTWTTSGTWTQLSTSFTTGASVTSVTVWVHGWYGQGDYSADDIALG
jgi:hypothetical protein